MRNEKNIVLCGFMGCSKTTVGKLLSEKTGRPFIDLDEYIEKAQNKSVSEIFDTLGEQYFRDAEHQACIEICKKSGYIIALGGGTICNADNAKILTQNCVVVFIDTSLETIKQRLNGDTTRPLLLRDDKDKYMDELYYSRRPLYMKSCDFTVSGDSTAINTANEILRCLEK